MIDAPSHVIYFSGSLRQLVEEQQQRRLKKVFNGVGWLCRCLVVSSCQFFLLVCFLVIAIFGIKGLFKEWMGGVETLIRETYGGWGEY